MVGTIILYSYLETVCTDPTVTNKGEYIRQHAFKTNGLGSLAEAISCTVTQERNGAYELEMEYPVTGLRYNDIKLRNIIFCTPNHYDGPQAFRIYSISKPISGAITIKACHISYDLSGWTCEPFRADTPTQFFNLIKNSIEPASHVTEFGSMLCPFEFKHENFTNPQNYSTTRTYVVGDLCIHPYTDAPDVDPRDTTWRCVHDVPNPEEWNESHWQLAYHEYDVPASVKANIGANKNSFLSRFGGDVWYDNFTVHFQNTPEVDRHVIIRYGRNMTDFGIEETCSSQYSAVLPYWKASSNTQTITRLLDPSTYPGSVVKVNPADSSVDYSRVIAVDLSSEFTNEPDDIKMIGFCNEYIRNNNLDKPVTSVKVSFVRLSDTAEYKNFASLEDTRLTDKVTVVHNDLNVTVNMYVSEMVYDVIAGKYESITLGEKPKTVIDTIANTAQAVTPQGFSMTDMARTALTSLGVPEALADKIIDVSGKVIDFGKDTWAALGFSVNPLNPGESLASKKETQTIHYLQSPTTGTAPLDPRGSDNQAIWVTSTSTSANVWTTVEPTEIAGGTYYTCEQTRSTTKVEDNEVIAVANATVKKVNTASSIANIIRGSGSEAKATNLDDETVDTVQIVPNAVTQSKLATDAIHSNGYSGPVGTEIYSHNGSFLDLANGNFITPSLRLYGTPVLGEAALYLKGAIEAEEGSKIGELEIKDDEHWEGDTGTRLEFLQGEAPGTGTYAYAGLGRYDFKYANENSLFEIITADDPDILGHHGEIKIHFETYKFIDDATTTVPISYGMIDNSGIDFTTYDENSSTIAEFKMDEDGVHLTGKWDFSMFPTPTSADAGLFLKVDDDGEYVLGEGGGTSVDTWRPVKVDGVSFLSSSTSSNSINFVAGENITLTTTTNGAIIFSATGGGSSGVSSIATGDNNGQIKVIPAEGTAYNVNVKGLGSAAYTNSNSYAAASHQHYGGDIITDNTLAVDDDTDELGVNITWSDGRYALKTHNHTGVYSPVGHTHPLSDITFGSSKIDGGNINHDSSLDDTDGILSLSTSWLNTRYSQTGHTHTKSQITDFPTSMPASDVYAWAKASTKPTYTYSEVGAAPTSHDHAASEIIHNNTLAADENDELGVNVAWADARYAQKTHTHTKSQITDFPTSMPASDVYSWAKAATKPSYSWTEITSKPTTFTPSSHRHSITNIDFGSNKLDAGVLNYGSSLTNTDGVLNVNTTWGDNRYSLTSHTHSQYLTSAVTSLGNKTGALSVGGGLGFSGTTLEVSIGAGLMNDGGNLAVDFDSVAQKTHTHTKTQITDFPTSMPASDVYAWAKASTKPSYTYSEVGAAAASHVHVLLKSNTDYRSTNTIPSDYNGVFEIKGLKYNSTIGISNHGSYSGVFGMRPWGDHSGGYAHEFALVGDGALFHRSGDSTSWNNSWEQLITSSNYSTWCAAASHTHTKSQITNFPTSMPASDVYAWAKAATKPTYTYSEVGAAAASHTHSYTDISGNIPFSKITIADSAIDASKLSINTTTLSRTDGVLGVNTSWADGRYPQSPTRTLRDFGSGTLITTDLPGNSTSLPFRLSIRGNGYGEGVVFTEVTGYVYIIYGNLTYIRCFGLGMGVYPSYVNAFNNSDNKLCFWFPRLGYWHGYDVTVYECNSWSTYANHVVSVTDAAMPTTGITYLTRINVYKQSYSYSDVGAAAASHRHNTTTLDIFPISASQIYRDSTLTDTDGYLGVNTSLFFTDAGSNPTTGTGGGIVQPGGAAVRSIRTTDGGGRDVGIFYLSQDNAYIANSSDNCYTFAVFDTDLTTDFSNPSNASFVVASNGGGCLIRGNTVIHSGNIGSQSVAYASSAGSAPQTWRPIKINGSNYITDSSTSFDIVQGNHITIRKPSAGRIIIDYDGTCLIEGTLITMADGSTKPIEEIQKGDVIKSYDPTTGEIISAYALDLECTGSTNEYKYTIFDDGSEIVTYGNHSLYSKDLGYPKDIEKWQMGDKGINLSGETIEMLDQGNVTYKGSWKKHYVLYSSNNLYFANNILTCHWGSTKYKHLKDFDLDVLLPKTVMDVFEEEEHKYGDKGQWMLSKEYVTELVSIRKRRNTLFTLIEDCKKKLADTDYVGQKYLEGLISAMEWLKHKADRAGWRKLINDNESELESLENQIAAIKSKYKTPHTQRERFAEYVTMCNSIFNDLTKYYKGEK